MSSNFFIIPSKVLTVKPHCPALVFLSHTFILSSIGEDKVQVSLINVGGFIGPNWLLVSSISQNLFLSLEISNWKEYSVPFTQSL